MSVSCPVCGVQRPPQQVQRRPGEILDAVAQTLMRIASVRKNVALAKVLDLYNRVRHLGNEMFRDQLLTASSSSEPGDSEPLVLLKQTDFETDVPNYFVKITQSPSVR
jgi:hypothetical protein